MLTRDEAKTLLRCIGATDETRESYQTIVDAIVAYRPGHTMAKPAKVKASRSKYPNGIGPNWMSRYQGHKFKYKPAPYCKAGPGHIATLHEYQAAMEAKHGTWPGSLGVAQPDGPSLHRRCADCGGVANGHSDQSLGPVSRTSLLS